MTPTGLKIVREISIALQRAEAPMELVCTIGSWGDTLDEKEVLDLLQHFNEGRGQCAEMVKPLRGMKRRCKHPATDGKYCYFHHNYHAGLRLMKKSKLRKLRDWSKLEVSA